MKNCLNCDKSYNPSGNNQKYCFNCRPFVKLKQMNDWYYRTKQSGPGSGAKKFEDGGRYKHALCVFRRWARERLKQLDYCCERCGNKIDASIRGTWAGHHKDHNRQNNIKENLEVLCKRCHQIEHECWRAFQSVETIPKGSTQETVEAHGPSI
jgi:hypothetical protein